MDTASKDQDFQVVEQLRAGEKEAFRYLFDTYGSRIYAFGLSYLKNKSDAEELLQEVFLKLWEIKNDLDSAKSVKSLLFKICINLIYDQVRRKNVQQAYLNYSGINHATSSENTWDEVIYEDTNRNLQRLIASIPEQRQRIFRMSKEQGLSNEEIAGQLNLSQRTVENQLYRAINFLKNQLDLNSLPALLLFFLYCK